jgi:hypothetical protein
MPKKALGAICFKFHDQPSVVLIGFQSARPKTSTPNNAQMALTLCDVIVSLQLNQCQGMTHEHAHSQQHWRIIML